MQAGYRQLDAWREACALAEAVYAVAKSLPVEERFGVMAQLQDAAAAVPVHLEEGCRMLTPCERLRCFLCAQEALQDVETHLLIAVRLQMATSDRFDTVWSLLYATAHLLPPLIATCHPFARVPDEPPMN